MNRLAPAHMAGLIMGTWFFASAAGNFAAGLIAAATGAEGAGSDGAMDVYTTVGWSAVAVGVLVFIISPLVKKLMHLDTLQTQSLSGEEEVGVPAAAGVNIDRKSKRLNSVHNAHLVCRTLLEIKKIQTTAIY